MMLIFKTLINNSIQPNKELTHLRLLILLMLLLAVNFPVQADQPSNTNHQQTESSVPSKALLDDKPTETDDLKEDETSKEAIYRNAIDFANWVDNFFGEKQELESAGYDYLRLINNLVIREGESPVFRPRIKAKVHLPQMSNTTSLLFSNDRSASTKDFATQEFVQNDIDDDSKNDLSAAINFQAKNTVKSKLDFRLGLDSSLDVFAFVRHRRPLVNNGSLDIENSSYLFWEEENGFGVATEFELNQILSEESLFRWKYSILRAEKSEGNEWSNRFTLVNHLADHKWITYDISIRGETALNYDVEQYRFAVRYRNRTPIEWLYYEIEPEVRFIRNERYAEREMVPGITLRLEIQFEKQ